MGAQTIRKNTLNSILNKVDEFYIEQGEKYILNSDYNIGGEVNLPLFVLMEKMDNILTTGACVDTSTEDILEKINLILLRK